MTDAGPDPINGQEVEVDPSKPVGALSEFYRGFNDRDLTRLGQNWLNSEDASMDNPVGGIRRGWTEIRDVYARIFSAPGRVQVEFHDYTLHCSTDTFLAVGRERGTLVTPDLHLDLRIRTSRWFRFVDGRWRQMHHHGSIDDPALLARYQAAVR